MDDLLSHLSCLGSAVSWEAGGGMDLERASKARSGRAWRQRPRRPPAGRTVAPPGIHVSIDFFLLLFHGHRFFRPV
jgi:hypothetical protein